MFPSTAMSNSTSISEEASISSVTRTHIDFVNNLNSLLAPSSPHQKQQQQQPKKKRNQPGNPDPVAEVVALSPKALMATNRFVCEICNKGFQRDQNLQLHRRGHNLPWRLKQRSGKEAARKRVYVCPEPTCVHHHPSRALGDLTGIKKHFCRKHGEKKWNCEKCSKKYAVQSDWKAHVKNCGNIEYRCDCGTIFSRKDSFITHRAFCDALAEESARLISNSIPNITPTTLLHQPFPHYTNSNPSSNPNPNFIPHYISNPNPNSNTNTLPFHMKRPEDPLHPFHSYFPSHQLFIPATTGTTTSATALLQRAASIGPLPPVSTQAAGFDVGTLSMCRSGNQLTRDFLGVVSSDVPDDEELLPLSCLDLDVAHISSPFSHGGDHTKTLPGFYFPPATGAWGDC